MCVGTDVAVGSGVGDAVSVGGTGVEVGGRVGEAVAAGGSVGSGLLPGKVQPVRTRSKRARMREVLDFISVVYQT